MSALERLRRSRLVPSIALVGLLGPLLPRSAFAQSAASSAPVDAVAQLPAAAALGATETSASGATGLATAAVDPSSGILHTSVPFQLPTARGAAQPSLALEYSSTGSCGVGGRGWSLALPSIERHNPSGFPRYDDPPTGQAVDPANEDRFTFAGAPLVEICWIDSNTQCL
jgi:hypothetical protein